MKKYILFILMIVSILACTKTLDFDDEGLANKLVFNGIIQTGDSFNANLLRSSSILSEPREGAMFAGGTILLYENGTLLSTASSPLGQFSLTDIKPKAGANYRIVVNTENEMIEAATNIPQKAEVISVDTSSVKNEFGRWTNYKVNIKDPLGEDYYRLVLMSESLSFYTSKDSLGNDKRYYAVNTHQWLFNSDDPVFKNLYNNFGQDVIDAGPNNDYSIFTDDYFQGKGYSLQFQVYNSYNGGGYGYSDPSSPNLSSGIIYQRYIIHVQKLSKELFNYLKYIKLYEFYHDDPFAEPVPVYSNIINGVGIFAGVNDEAQFSFQETYIPFSMDTIKIEENGYNNGGGYSY